MDGIASNTGNEEFPPQRDLESFDGCADRLGGWVEASGSLVNRSTTAASYRIVVGYSAGEDRIEENGTWVSELGPGERRRFDVAVWLPDGPTIDQCAVLVIDRWNAGDTSNEVGEPES